MKTYFTDKADVPVREPAPGVKLRFVQAEHATMAFFDLDPKAILPSHKHDVEQFGVIVKGSLVMAIAGEQRILVAGDTYRIPPNTAHGARVLEEPTQVVDCWAPPRTDLV